MFARLPLVLILAIVSGCNPLTSGSLESRSSSPSAMVKSVGQTVATRMRPQPSHDRLWRQNQLILPFAEIESGRVILRNVRDCTYRSEDDYDVNHFDREIHLTDLESLDFLVIPFQSTPSLAHTMLSFGTRDGQYLVFSVEARMEQGETYHPLEGAVEGYELMWVVGTERDLISLRTEIRKDDVYLYRTSANQDQIRKIFLAAAARINEIARQPEFYDTLSNNCTTNIVALVNELQPNTIPEDIRILLPGHSDKLLYDLGLLAVHGPAPFPVIKQASRITPEAKLHFGDADFSRAIRRQLQ